MENLKQRASPGLRQLLQVCFTSPQLVSIVDHRYSGPWKAAVRSWHGSICADQLRIVSPNPLLRVSDPNMDAANDDMSSLLGLL